MNLTNSFIEALESITSNKLRSGLTMLGIIIGVASVVAMLAIGNGAEESILGEIEGIGTNLIFITSGADDVTNPEPLTLGDMEALDDPFLAPSVAAVSAGIMGTGEISFSGESSLTSVVGVTPDYMAIQNLELSEGEIITQQDINGRASVAILGIDPAEELFGRTYGLVGETIRVEGQPFRVIGVIEEQGGSATGSNDDQVLIPISTAQVRVHTRANRDQVDVIFASAVSSEAVSEAMSEISLVLQERHRTAIGEEDFTIYSQQTFLDIASSITGVLTILLGGIAGISLLVGGIGIMNIMLVSVIERTKEIGLRKAMGARKSNILSQFLVESLVLSVIGGILGILLGWGISALIGIIADASDFALIPVMGLDAIILATAFSAVVGIFFGLYPANRAANLQPVEALRSE
jgi:putative ABC transport system permease protein